MNSLKFKKNLGVSMVEMLVILGFFAAISGAAFLTYPRVLLNLRINATLDQAAFVQHLVINGTRSAKSFAGMDTRNAAQKTATINMGLYPSDVRSHPLQGVMDYIPVGPPPSFSVGAPLLNHLLIALYEIPVKACVRLVSQAIQTFPAGVGIVDNSFAGTPIFYSDASTPDFAALETDCSTIAAGQNKLMVLIAIEKT